MTRKQTLLTSALVLLLLILSIGGAALAQTSPSYNLEWHVIGGGGQPVSSASYVVNSTAGQGAASPRVAHPRYLVSAHYAVSGGYWFGDGITIIYPLYLPIVRKNSP